jgi:hypothetical protein
MHNYNTNRSLLSSIPQNPQNTTGLGGNSITSPIEAYISTITVNFAKISQNDANFTARVSLDPAQKISIITAVDRSDNSLNDQKGGRDDA